MIAGNAWLTAIILALVLVLGIGAVELLSQAAQPLSDVMIGEPMCIQPDGSVCPELEPYLP